MDTNNNFVEETPVLEGPALETPVQEAPKQTITVQAGPTAEKKNGISIAALVCGIVGFCCCNPLYLVSIAAIVLGLIGMNKNDSSKNMAIAGLILGAVSIAFCLIVDLLMLPLTFGLGFFL